MRFCFLSDSETEALVNMAMKPIFLEISHELLGRCSRSWRKNTKQNNCWCTAHISKVSMTFIYTIYLYQHLLPVNAFVPIYIYNISLTTFFPKKILLFSHIFSPKTTSYSVPTFSKTIHTSTLPKTNMSPENWWLVQMYFLLKYR